MPRLKLKGLLFLRGILQTLSVIILCIFATSCSKAKCGWEERCIRTTCPKDTYRRVSFPPENTFDGIELEWISSNTDSTIYLNVYNFEFPTLGSDEGYSEVLITVDEYRYAFAAIRFAGGQKIVLPQEAHELVLDALLNGKTLKIQVGKYTYRR